LTLLGAFEARVGGRRPLVLPKKTQALLAYVALSPRAVTRRELSSLLWGDTSDEQARASLRQALFSLRQTLGRAGAGALAFDRRQLLYPLPFLREIVTRRRRGGRADRKRENSHGSDNERPSCEQGRTTSVVGAVW
jgi:hypothetical protein